MTQDNVFELAHGFVERWEGGYDDDPADSGGVTNHGVSLAFLTDLFEQGEAPFLNSLGITGANRENIKKLTKEHAKALFKLAFWEKPKTYLLEDAVAIAFYDTAVNCGAYRAAKLLQAAVGAEQDGIVGPKTRSLVKMYGSYSVAMNMIAKRDNFYRNLAEKRPKDKKFLKGWLNRTADLRKLIDGVYGDDFK